MKDNKTHSFIPYKGKILKLSNLESGKIFYKNYYLDLKTNNKVQYNILNWVNSLDARISTYYNQIKVIHLFYELGHIIESTNCDFSEDCILAIDLTYKEFDDVKLNPSKKIQLENLESPNFQKYEEKFQMGRAELIQGNCYQFNLTDKFVFHFNNDVSSFHFVSNLWSLEKNRGAFASATYIPLLNKLFLSNSPECLFKMKDDVIYSMPIKGTLKIDNEEEIDKKFNELLENKKCESELFMIADLLRNDLSKIDLPRAKITKAKEKLIVPGLIHQYSEIVCPLRDKVEIKNIVKNIFPGGSITGAPKKNVMKILDKIENRVRGFYCGSTMIFFKELKAASINIRSSEIDFNQNILLYQAGGGITIKSTAREEYEEMSYKVSSYIDTLTL